MKIIIGFILAIIFLFISLIHFYWALGGRWGKDEAIPKTSYGVDIMSPKIIDCLAVSFVLIICAVLVLHKSSFLQINLPIWISKYSVFFIAIVFALRAIGDFKYVGFFKKIRSTKFGLLDMKFYSPLCLIISILCLLLECV